MNATDCDERIEDIHDINLSYLLFAQRLIREDRHTAGFRLGLDDATIDSLKDLTLPQLIKLSATNQLICRLRVDNEIIIEHLTKDSRIDALQKIHTGIILSTQLLNSLLDQNTSAA